MIKATDLVYQLIDHLLIKLKFDFNIQKLIPHKFTEFAHAIAVGDVDGNGLEDMIIGGSINNSAQILLSKLQNSGIALNDQQHDKLDLMVKILIYYRSVVRELIDTNCNLVTSPEWVVLIRFYTSNENNKFKVLVKVRFLFLKILKKFK